MAKRLLVPSTGLLFLEAVLHVEIKGLVEALRITHDGAIAAEATRATTAEAELQQKFEGLVQASADAQKQLVEDESRALYFMFSRASLFNFCVGVFRIFSNRNLIICCSPVQSWRRPFFLMFLLELMATGLWACLHPLARPFVCPFACW